MSDETQDGHGAPIVLRAFGSRVEAEIVAGALRDAGIETLVRADDLGGTDPALWMVRGVQVLVRPEDRERAEAVVASISPVEDGASGEGDGTPGDAIGGED